MSMVCIDDVVDETMYRAKNGQSTCLNVNENIVEQCLLPTLLNYAVHCFVFYDTNIHITLANATS